MTEQKVELFSGRIVTVTYDDGAGFRIVKIQPDDGGLQFVAKGHFVGQNIVPGTWVSFEGLWGSHPTYGRQVSVFKSPVIPGAWDDKHVLSVLTAQGVGHGQRALLESWAKTQAQSLVELLDAGNLPSDLMAASDRWKAAKAHLYSAAFLASTGIPGSIIDRIWRMFSTDVENIVSQNPWALLQVEGVTFAQADEVAIKMGVPISSPLRMEGAVRATMNQSGTDGHVYSTMSDVLERVFTLIPGASDKSVADAVKSLVRSGDLALDRTTKEDVVAIYSLDSFQMESECSRLLLERMATSPRQDSRPYYTTVGAKAAASVAADSPLSDVVSAALSDWSDGSGVALTEDQLRAAKSALMDNVCLVTGLPGTGKTTALKAVVSVLKDARVSFLLAAPTGIAAKRMSSVVNAPASTIHRAFGARGRFGDDDEREVTYEGILGDTDKNQPGKSGDVQWGYGPGNPHPADVVVIDETSMVDMSMLYRVLVGTRTDCRLVFVGDPYQLPSVGAGDVLGDLVESRVFPHTHLDRIFRQDDTNGIVLAAHAIHKGVSPDFDDRDFVLVPASTEIEASEIVLKIAKSLYDNRANFQVLSPRHSGDAGVTSLNDRIRSQLNPAMSGMAETKIHGSVVREGDRIMVVKNDYQKGVYNGDVGTVRRIDRSAKEIEASVFGMPGTPHTIVRFPLTDAAKTLRLAYAQTVHKCVHPNTLVWYGQGLSRIKDIPDSGAIGTPDGVRSYQDKVTYPPGALLRIETERGYIMYVTPEHGVDVWDRQAGAYVRKLASEIVDGDWTMLVPSPSMPDTVPVLVPMSTQDMPRMTFPQVLDEDLAELIGILLAHAKVRHHGINLNFLSWVKADKKSVGREDYAVVVNRFCDLYFKIFGRNPRAYVKSDRPYLMRIRLKLVIGWIWKNFPEVFRSRGYGMPAAILSSPRNVRRAFLRGYCISIMELHDDPEDRASALRCLWIKPRSEDLAIGLRALLLDEGVVCRKIFGNNLILRGRDIDRFLNRVGFSSPEVYRLANTPKLDYNLDYSMPISSAESASVYGDGSHHHAPVDFAVRHMPTLASRARYVHDRVRGVTKTWGTSMCVTVPDTHRFLQNGFSGWNSQGQEYDVIVVPILSTFGRQLQRNLLYTAITRARKKVMVVGQVSAIAKAVKNDISERRKTLLAERLRGGLSPPSIG